MTRLALALLFCAAFGLDGLSARSADAAKPRAPSYLVLRAPARAHKGHAYYPGRGYEVKTHAYAYGWFGAKPRRHWRRHTGYNSAYIQWSRQ